MLRVEIDIELYPLMPDAERENVIELYPLKQ
jgi:hypothetical protein